MENKDIINPDLILKKYEGSHEFHFHKLDRNWIIECMNEYKDACVKQEKEEWEKERVLYEEEIKYKSGVLSNNRHTFNEMQKEIEALKSNLYIPPELS